jgi:hypothetical protein
MGHVVETNLSSLSGAGSGGGAGRKGTMRVGRDMFTTKRGGPLASLKFETSPG